MNRVANNRVKGHCDYKHLLSNIDRCRCCQSICNDNQQIDNSESICGEGTGRGEESEGSTQPASVVCFIVFLSSGVIIVTRTCIWLNCYQLPSSHFGRCLSYSTYHATAGLQPVSLSFAMGTVQQI